MLQLLYQFLMTQLCRTFMMTLWIVNRFEKHIRRIWNIVSMTAHSINVLSDIKMTSFGPYAGAKTRSSSVALPTALCCSPCQMSIPQRRELLTSKRAAGQGSK